MSERALRQQGEESLKTSGKVAEICQGLRAWGLPNWSVKRAASSGPCSPLAATYFQRQADRV
jgi:hypothetical protein